MLSICLLLFGLVGVLIMLKFKPSKFLKIVLVFLVNIVILEILSYGYFLFLVYKATCFFLIGSQSVLDTLIKVRLDYAIYYSQGKKSFINQVNNDLGYTLGKDKDTQRYQTNGQGIRANKEYSLFPSESTLRVAAFGDSFVFCDEEKNVDAWPYILENMSSNLEVLNFGVPGYGLGQSYLRYLKDGLRFNPDIIFINYVLLSDRDGIQSENFVGFQNLRLSQFYRMNFWLEKGHLYSKSTTPYDLFDPKFRKKYLYEPLGMEDEPLLWKSWFLSKINSGLLLKQIIIQRTLSKYIHKQSNTPDENVNLKILENLIEMARVNNSEVLFYFNTEFSKLPPKVQNILSKINVTYVNKSEAMNEQIKLHNIKDSLLNSSNHYNALGNQLYAKAVLKVLQSKSWGTGDRKFVYDDKFKTFKNPVGKAR